MKKRALLILTVLALSMTGCSKANKQNGGTRSSSEASSEETQTASETEAVNDEQSSLDGASVEEITWEEENKSDDDNTNENEIHEYEFYTEDVSWEEAWKLAADKGGYLAHINSEEEYNLITDKISKLSDSALCYFIGGKREGSDKSYYWFNQDGSHGEKELTEDEGCKKFWLEGEPSYTDSTSGAEEKYLDFLYIKSKDKWFLNDAPNDMIAASKSWSGKIGYIVEYDSKTSVADDTTENETRSDEESIFSSEHGTDFYFMSGAGGWSSEMTVYPDGSFKGTYHDSEMGSTGPGYPGGELYLCDFSGKFSNIHKVNDLTWSMTIESLDEKEVNDGEIKDGVKIIQGTAYGLDDGKEFEIYMPGTDLSTLTEDAKSWYYGYGLEENGTLDNMLIYNVNGGYLWMQGSY